MFTRFPSAHLKACIIAMISAFGANEPLGKAWAQIISFWPVTTAAPAYLIPSRM